jgi:hypothetical protein
VDLTQVLLAPSTVDDDSAAIFDEVAAARKQDFGREVNL